MKTEDQDWQRLDKWLWCARFMRARSDCARLVGEGTVRLNRQPTDKAHARLRVGDVLTRAAARSGAGGAGAGARDAPRTGGGSAAALRGDRPSSESCGPCLAPGGDPRAYRDRVAAEDRTA